MKGKCERCNDRNSPVTTMSMFNTEEICIPCKDKERLHPKYAEAQKAEQEQIKQGNYNLQGIGKPADL